jgi:hypothetical protein
MGAFRCRRIVPGGFDERNGGKTEMARPAAVRTTIVAKVKVGRAARIELKAKIPRFLSRI